MNNQTNINTNNFKTAEIADKFKAVNNKFNNFLQQLNKPEISTIQTKFHQALNKHYQQGFLTVAFVGQYSTGKSTIISALTGKRNIRIGADITTDTTANYDWNGIKLIDTPGLFTDRQDHDEITYDAIRQSDLLVFNLTYMLFDSITAENFKKLAYELGYRWKMMLVVNKMADGAGEEEELIANYSKSLAVALEPYSLDDFPVCFIDAKDYCEGVDEEDDFLMEVSRFQTFTDELNTFVKNRGSLAKFDTPIRIALGYVNETQLTLIRDNNKDAVYLELLHRLSRKVNQERDRLGTTVKSIALRISVAIAHEGMILADKVGMEDIEPLGKEVESEIEELCKKAGLEMEEAVRTAIDSLQEEIKEVIESDLAEAFIRRLEVNEKFFSNSTKNINSENINSEVDLEQLRQQVHSFKKLGDLFSQGLSNLAIKPGVNQTQGILSAGNVAGSHLHQGIYGIGKLIGVNFKPYGAVNIAKGIGNFAKFLGPIIAVGALVVDIHTQAEEEKRDREIADVKKKITSDFIAMGKDLESQMEAQLREVENEIYTKTENQIAQERQKEENAIATSDISIKQLVEIRENFDSILQDITRETLINQ
ncbi:MAG: GTPase [Cyanobacteria bacterium P01_A01_bin.84]